MATLCHCVVPIRLANICFISSGGDAGERVYKGDRKGAASKDLTSFSARGEKRKFSQLLQHGPQYFLPIVMHKHNILSKPRQCSDYLFVSGAKAAPESQC